MINQLKNFKSQPLVSIITISLNSEKTITKTIESVKNQTYKNIEYIIIDGKSEDRTIDIVHSYKDNISKIISEKDDGIYDAFNKGLNLYKGDLIGFVNSDDVLLPNAIEILVDYYNRYKDKDFFFGSVKKHWAILYGYKPWKIFYTWGFYSSHSTGFYIKREAAKIVGTYNTKYKYSADYDYFYRMIIKHKLKGVGTKKNELFGIFSRGGFSSKINFYHHLCECTQIRLDNGQNKLIVLLTFVLKYIMNYRRIK
jgi:glycosyltransferase involved in cell wall biosynthesis